MAARLFQIVFLVLAGLSAAHAESWPIKKGQVFYKARIALLHDGWKPVIVFTKAKMDLPENSIGEGRQFYRHGFKEVQECSQGRGYCSFHYQKGDQCLFLSTEGEYIPPKSPTIDGWWTYPAPQKGEKSYEFSSCSDQAFIKARDDIKAREY